MTSRNVVLTTHAYTHSPNGMMQASSPIDGQKLVHVPGDGLCWFYTILLGFLTLRPVFKVLFGEFISSLDVPLYKSLLSKDDVFASWNVSQEFWNECFIIINHIKREIIEVQDQIQQILNEKYPRSFVEWTSVFKPDTKKEGFFHSFRVVEIFFSLVLGNDRPFTIKVCSSDFLGLSENYGVPFCDSAENTFCVYYNRGHYWFIKDKLDFIPLSDQDHQPRQSMTRLIEHNEFLEGVIDEREKEIDDLRKQLEFLMTQNSKLESENASLTASLHDANEANSVLKLQLSASDQLYAEEFGRRS